jgi:hypothetical protein
MQEAPRPQEARFQMAKNCRMCGDPVTGVTKEHVFPDWLITQFGLRNQYISYTPVEMQGGASLQLSVPNNTTPRRQHYVGGMLLGAVCGKCNSGWMSDLEGKVKADLIRLIGKADEQPSDRSELAQWVLKTAYTLSHFLDPPVVRVPRFHGLWPRDAEGLPPGVTAFHRQMTDSKLWFSAPLTFLVEETFSEATKSRHRSSYRYVIQIGHALFMVQFWADSTATLVYNSEICGLLAGEALDCPEPILEVPQPSAEFEMIMATRYEARSIRMPKPGEFCHCGSGLELTCCSSLGHTKRLDDNWGWLEWSRLSGA